MSMQPLALKKTCDTCTRSKVKCSGGFPCSRCESKGIQCFYSPRKKRGIQPKKEEEFDEDECDQPFAYGPIVTKSNFDTHPKGALGSLAAHERRSWSVFFTLYKHYGTSCSLYWFNRQLRKMQSYLERRGDTEALDRLTTWMEAISIDIKTLTDSMEKCKLKVMSKAVIHPPGIVSLYGIRGSVRDPDEPKLLQVFEEKKRSKTPFIKIKTKFLDDEQEGVEIQCNEAFTKVFGHTAENLEKELNWAGGGLLPWGGDILGRLLTREKDLLAFVQILAIKFNTFGPPKEIPTVREIPSCHIMEVEIKDGPDNGRKVTVNCLIKCVHREVLKIEGSTLDISIDLTPLAPHDHLLDPDRIVSTVELERPAEVYKIKRRAVDELTLSQSQEDPNVAISKNNKKKVRETNGGGQARIQKPEEDVILVQPVEIKQNENGDYEQISEENATNGSYAVDASQKSLYDFGLSQSNMSQLSIFDLDDAKEPTQRSEVEVEASQRSTYSAGVTTHKILNNQIGGTKDDKKGQLKAKTASLSELEEFLQGDMPEETAEEYLNVDTQKSVLIDDALEQFAEDEDYHIEDDWFEDLLDWSSQSTVPPEYRPKRLLNPRN